MIKKILSTLLVSSALLVVASTSSIADRPTFSVGYTAAYGGYEATGTEHEGSVDPQEQNNANEAGEYGYSSLFLEVNIADRLTLGASWMIDDVTTDMSSRVDATNHTDRDAGTDEGTSTVKVNFSNFVTGYAELNLYKGMYVKYGLMEMDLETKENLHTDSAYPNAEMDGTTYGFGWKGAFDNGVFVKTETMMQEWSDISLLGTGATGDDNNTKIDASLSGAIATFSIGKAF